MARHQLAFNFSIHMIGIPIAVAGVVLLFLTDWYWGVAAIFLGYLLQYVGHRAEGNDVGEWAGIKHSWDYHTSGFRPGGKHPASPDSPAPQQSFLYPDLPESTPEGRLLPGPDLACCYRLASAASTLALDRMPRLGRICGFKPGTPSNPSCRAFSLQSEFSLHPAKIS